jgi:hypothetical protein
MIYFTKKLGIGKDFTFYYSSYYRRVEENSMNNKDGVEKLFKKEIL